MPDGVDEDTKEALGREAPFALSVLSNRHVVDPRRYYTPEAARRRTHYVMPPPLPALVGTAWLVRISRHFLMQPGHLHIGHTF